MSNMTRVTLQGGPAHGQTRDVAPTTHAIEVLARAETARTARATPITPDTPKPRFGGEPIAFMTATYARDREDPTVFRFVDLDAVADAESPP